MAEEFKLEMEVYSIWYLDVHSATKGLKEILTNLDALTMANFVDSNREMYVCIRITEVCVIYDGVTGDNTT